METNLGGFPTCADKRPFHTQTISSVCRDSYHARGDTSPNTRKLIISQVLVPKLPRIYSTSSSKEWTAPTSTRPWRSQSMVISSPPESMKPSPPSRRDSSPPPIRSRLMHDRIWTWLPPRHCPRYVDLCYCF